VNQVGKISEGSHQRQREPVACRFSDADLIFHIVRQVRQSITLLETTLRRDCFITTGERHGLEREEGNLLWIVQGEPDNRTDLIVVNSVDQRSHEYDLNPRLMQIVNRPQLDVKKIADLPMTIRIVAHPIKLEIHI